jgi:uncharacterized protein YjeT (DUF2065 family)
MTSVVAHVVSAVMLVLGVSYIVRTREWIRVSREVIEAPHRFMVVALVLLAMGVAVISVHNRWVPAWPLAITLTGWLLAVKGALFLVFPQIATKYARWPEATLRTASRAVGAVLAVVGAVLTYLVWFGR